MDLVEYRCEFCNNVFVNKQNLAKHVKTAKFCLKIRKVNLSQFKCACGKTFAYELNYQNHIDECIIAAYEEEKRELNETIQNLNNIIFKKDQRLNRIITEKDQEIQKLKEMVNKLEKDLSFGQGQISVYEKAKPRTKNITNNNGTTINNPKIKKLITNYIRPLTENIAENLEEYTYHKFLQGVPGLVKFLLANTQGQFNDANGNKYIERNYANTDKTRDSNYALVQVENASSYNWVTDQDLAVVSDALDLLVPKVQNYIQQLRIRNPPIVDGIGKDGLTTDQTDEMAKFGGRIIAADGIGSSRDDLLHEIALKIRKHITV